MVISLLDQAPVVPEASKLKELAENYFGDDYEITLSADHQRWGEDKIVLQCGLREFPKVKLGAVVPVRELTSREKLFDRFSILKEKLALVRPWKSNTESFLRRAEQWLAERLPEVEVSRTECGEATWPSAEYETDSLCLRKDDLVAFLMPYGPWTLAADGLIDLKRANVGEWTFILEKGEWYYFPDYPPGSNLELLTPELFTRLVKECFDEQFA